MEAMKLESLRQAWADSGEAARPVGEIEAILDSRQKRARDKALRNLAGAIVAVLLVYGLVPGLLFMADHHPHAYHWWAVYVGLLGTSLLVGILAGNLRRTRANKWSASVLELLRETIKENERWVGAWRRLVAISCLLWTCDLWSDAAFRMLPIGWKAASMILIAIIAGLVRPLLARFYGRRIAEMKRGLEEWTDE
jgi:hypothetical protein